MKNQNEYEKESKSAQAEKNLSIEELKAEILRLQEEAAAERAQKEFLLSAIEALPNPVFLKDGEGRFVYFNKNYEEFFGMAKENYIGKSVLELPFLPMESRERYQNEDIQLIANTSLLHYEIDYTSEKGEICPSFYWSHGFEVPETGEKGLVGEIVNISKEKEVEKQLKANIAQLEMANATIASASRTDALTGVFNRCFLKEQEKAFLANVPEKMFAIYFLMLDLDHFKAVNDTFGHLEGDVVLVNFAKILKESCREKDLPIRYGGEEFLVFIYDVDLSIAKKIAERIRERCEKELFLPDGKTITVSIGISRYRQGEQLKECIARADEALYRAKEAGRNRVMTEE